MFGVFIKEGVSDWQIVQQRNGVGNLKLAGTYIIPDAALEVGTKEAHPRIRVLREDDNSQVLPWTNVNQYENADGKSGSWDCNLNIAAGGLYRLETGLDTISTNPNLRWMFRGDVRLHIGIGDIFIVAGQSNSSGYGKDSALDPPSMYVHLYRNRKTWDMACHPINESSFAAEEANTEMGVSGTSPFISFGKAFHELTHYPVGLVTTALGGSPISRWEKTENGDLFYNMIARIKYCGGRASGILWYQGCSDTTEEQSKNYYWHFKNLVKDTREELGYDIPFFTFQLNRQINGESDISWGRIREAQRRAAEELPGVYILPTINCSLSDGIHNSSHSSMRLGENMAKLCGNILYQTPEFLPPVISNATYEKGVISLSFRNVKRGFIIFTNLPKDSGFMVKDSIGTLEISECGTDNHNPNCLLLTLNRIPEEALTVSFAWEANPTYIPLLDEVSYMPPLSFYEFPVVR